MDFKNIKLNRNTVIVGAAVLAAVFVVAIVPAALEKALSSLSYVATVAFFISGTIWIWRHMK